MTDQLRPRVAAFLDAWVAYDTAPIGTDPDGDLYAALLATERAMDFAESAQCMDVWHLLAVLQDCFAAMRGGQ